MQCENSCLLASTLLPAEIVKKNLEKAPQKLAFATLVINNCSEAIQALTERNIKKLDALAGDFGCQLQALNLYTIATSETVREEALALNEELEKLKVELKKLQQFLGKKNILELLQVFLNKLDSIRLSTEMAYLVHAHLLTVTKQYYKKPDGYWHDRTDSGRIAKLIGGKLGPQISPIQVLIVKLAQSCLSYHSIAFIRQEAQAIQMLSANKKSRLIHMLQDENLHKSQIDSPKYFSCTYSNFKAILIRIRERQIPILIKNRQKENEEREIRLLYRSPQPGENFSLSSPEEIKALNTPLIVIEAAVRNDTSSQELIDLIRHTGLYKLLLLCTSQENPFEPKSSDLSMVSCQKTVREIEKYRTRVSEIDCAKNANPRFEIYHLYCSSLPEEALTGKEVTP